MKMTDLFNTVIFHEFKSDIKTLTDQERQALNDLHYRYLESKTYDKHFALNYPDVKLLKTLYDKSIKDNTKRVAISPSDRRTSKKLMRYRHNYRYLVKLLTDMDKLHRRILGL